MLKEDNERWKNRLPRSSWYAFAMSDMRAIVQSCLCAIGITPNVRFPLHEIGRQTQPRWK